MTVELAREEHGAGEPPFVFVHGWCCDRTFFAPQVEHFGASHRVVAPGGTASARFAARPHRCS